MNPAFDKHRAPALFVLALALLAPQASGANDASGRPVCDFGLSAAAQRRADRAIARAEQLRERADSGEVNAEGLSGAHRELALRCLDDAIATKEASGYPPLWVARSEALEDLGRTSDARAAQEVACRLATSGDADDELARSCQIRLAGLYREEGDGVRAAEAFLGLLERTPAYAWHYDMFRPSFRLPVVGKRGGVLANHYRAVPSPPSPAGRALGARWGPLDRFFTDYAMAGNPNDLLRKAEALKPGMDYKDVVRRVGFPSTNRMDEHAEGGITCWLYHYDTPILEPAGDDLVKFSASRGEIELHVLLRDGKLVRTETVKTNRTEKRP